MTVEVRLEDQKVRKFLNFATKRVGAISKRSKAYVGVISSTILRDIVDHFDKQMGPNGKWAPWSPAYRKRMIAKGKGGNLILTDTGRLRGGFTPARIRASRDGVMFFNPVQYARAHDEGTKRIPQRKYTWISRRALQRIEADTIRFTGFFR